MNTYQLIQDCQQRMAALQEAIPTREHQFRIAEIDELMTAADIWNDNRKAAALLKERRGLESLLNQLKKLSDDSSLLFEYADSFPNEVETLAEQAARMSEEVSTFELSQLFKHEADNSPALITITAGAGGLESANWVNMLMRMYLRFADARGYKPELLSLKPSEEHSAICIDSVSIRIEGDYAYGYLKQETGIHRLIRNSPFSSGDLRHTSFAAVSVSPDIEDIIDIQINEKDLDIQATRSGGSGGQAVNKISSCIILKHAPSGIMIRSQTESSQHENRRIAIKLLKSKLYDLEVAKKNAEKDKQLEQQASSAFGNQIRTMTLTPYSLVKDHRSGFESNQTTQFLDGNIQPFLDAALHHAFKA
jgi:peptide chain release factor 2